MKKTFIVSQETLEKLGSASLVGSVMEPGLTELELRFQQTSYRWRQMHGGPDSWILQEYNVLCLVDDILWFTSQGVKVTTSWFTKD